MSFSPRHLNLIGDHSSCIWQVKRDEDKQENITWFSSEVVSQYLKEMLAINATKEKDDFSEYI